MNKAEKVLVLTLLILLNITSFTFGFLVFSPKKKPSATHLFVFDREKNILYIVGGTDENPITWSEIQRILVAFEVKSNYGIVTNSSIVFDSTSMFATEDLQELLDAIKKGKDC